MCETFHSTIDNNSHYQLMIPIEGISLPIKGIDIKKTSELIRGTTVT